MPQTRSMTSALAPSTQRLVDALQTVKLSNGLTMRYCDTAPGENDKPLVVFLHGWPECWFSWRHQLAAADARGYRAVAPDLRGFGGTDAPKGTEHYGVEKRVGDVAALLAHLGKENASFVGHDHGAATGWLLARLRPDLVRCYYALSVPTSPRPPFRPLGLLRFLYGDESQPEGSVYGLGWLFPFYKRAPRFMYMLYHCLPQAGNIYGANTRKAQLALQFSDIPFGEGLDDANYAMDGPMYYDDVAVPPFERVPAPTGLPDWATQAEVDYVVGEYERAGWEGGLEWYRTFDNDWKATEGLGKCAVPAAFLAGTKDLVVKMMGGRRVISYRLKQAVEGEVSIKFIEGAGHWIQQERPAEVNDEIFNFLDAHGK